MLCDLHFHSSRCALVELGFIFSSSLRGTVDWLIRSLAKTPLPQAVLHIFLSHDDYGFSFFLNESSMGGGLTSRPPVGSKIGQRGHSLNRGMGRFGDPPQRRKKLSWDVYKTCIIVSWTLTKVSQAPRCLALYWNASLNTEEFMTWIDFIAQLL